MKNFWYIVRAIVLTGCTLQAMENLNPAAAESSSHKRPAAVAGLVSVAVDSTKKLTCEEKESAVNVEVSVVIGRSGRVAKPAPVQPLAYKTVAGFSHTWKVPEFDEGQVNKIMAAFTFSKPVAQLLMARGYVSPEAVERFIHPSYDAQTLHPSQLQNALKAVMRIEQALVNAEPILMCGDYDPDGETSTTLMIKCLKRLGGVLGYKIPHRVKDGYGLKAPTVDFAKNNGYKLMITVDNGITAFDAAKRAKELGIDLIITDHHLAHHDLPDAYTIVNPNQPKCTHPSKFLAGVGVAFKLMSLLYERKNNEKLPDRALELMMVGTIADVVPQEGENRYWIRKGLELVNRTGGSASFRKLATNAGMESRPITSTDVAFGIAPQLNAIGRLEDANDAVRFLLEDRYEDVQTIGDHLKELNEKRKDVQAQMFKDLKEAINDCSMFRAKNNVIVASSAAWHLGVNGLVASKATEKYHKPTFIFTETTNEQGETILKGSARTINGFNVFEALNSCKDLLIAFGGHIAAAGMTLKKENVQALKDRLEQYFEDHFDRSANVIGGIHVDGNASFNDLRSWLMHDFSKIEPFGNANPQPHLVFDNVQVASDPKWMGKFGRGHVMCELTADGNKVPVKFFFKPDFFFILQELKRQNATFKLLGTPVDNYWKGRRTIEINAIDIEKVYDRHYTPDPNRQPKAPTHVHLYVRTETQGDDLLLEN